MDTVRTFMAQAVQELGFALETLLLPAAFFILLALVVKRRGAIRDAFRASHETTTNLLIHFLDAILVGPFIAFVAVGLSALVDGNFRPVDPRMWDALDMPILVAFLAVFCGDFIGYWRHRLEHGWLLWPSHAVHHSDTEMTWLTLSRFHPINRVTTTAFDGVFLFALGFPAYAIVANAIVRHYYGQFVHADLPWTYGPLRTVFVSPAMHRWHHALDRKAFNTNYATVFSCFDRWFGTFRVPGPCTAPLGVTDAMGSSVFDRMVYPLKRSSYRRFPKRRAATGHQADAGPGSSRPAQTATEPTSTMRTETFSRP